MRKLDPIPPGEILHEEFMRPLNLSQNRLAKEIYVPVNRISQIISAKRSITADTALRLARYFGTTPDFWLGLQAEYDLELARDQIGPEIDEIRTAS